MAIDAPIPHGEVLGPDRQPCSVPTWQYLTHETTWLASRGLTFLLEMLLGKGRRPLYRPGSESSLPWFARDVQLMLLLC
jgi:hypothetical protein